MKFNSISSQTAFDRWELHLAKLLSCTEEIWRGNIAWEFCFSIYRFVLFTYNLQGKLWKDRKTLFRACCKQYKLPCKYLREWSGEGVPPALSRVRGDYPLCPFFLRLWSGMWFVCLLWHIYSPFMWHNLTLYVFEVALMCTMCSAPSVVNFTFTFTCHLIALLIMS